MRFGSHPSFREGWIDEPAPGGGFVSYPAGVEPYINRRHIDGPLLYLPNGQLHWLTLWERLLLWLGQVDAFSLAEKHRNTPWNKL